MLQEMNIALRFLLELCILGVIGYWGFQVGKGPVIKGTFAVVLPLIIAVIWGLFGAPEATWKLQGALHLMLEIIILGLGIVALYHLRYVALATVFMIVIFTNSVLMYIWKQ